MKGGVNWCMIPRSAKSSRLPIDEPIHFNRVQNIHKNPIVGGMQKWV